MKYLSIAKFVARKTFAVCLLFFIILVFLSARTFVQKPPPLFRSELDEYKIWFHKCDKILFDLGANRGDTILRWFTEPNYNGRAKSSQIDLIYTFEQRKEFCVLSFEPNAKFNSGLLKIEKEMNKKGFKSKVKTETAVSNKFANSMMYIDNISTNSYGSSLLKDKKVNFNGKYLSLGTSLPVRLVNFTALLDSVPHNVEVVVKMDIEGGEYELLRSLISSGLACRINVLLIEFHGHKLPKNTIPNGTNMVLEWLLRSDSCGVRVFYDD